MNIPLIVVESATDQALSEYALLRTIVLVPSKSPKALHPTYWNDPVPKPSANPKHSTITSGYKCVVWLSNLLRHIERLKQLKDEYLLVQFGGAAGTLASLGNTDRGIRVRKRMAALFHLRDLNIIWHVSRGTIAEVVSFMALVGGNLGKIALDLVIMSSNEPDKVSRG